MSTKEQLTEHGFATSNVWYHGTSSALIKSITAQGLRRSGDRALKEAAKKTMATIGNDYSESVEPVFLTQSKELASYWANQTVKTRHIRLSGETLETPAIVCVTLPDALNQRVKPDVGAASLLLLAEGEEYIAHVAGVYQAQGLEMPNIDLMKADRLEFLNTLGMAYFDADLEAKYLQIVEA